LWMDNGETSRFETRPFWLRLLWAWKLRHTKWKRHIGVLSSITFSAEWEVIYLKMILSLLLLLVLMITGKPLYAWLTWCSLTIWNNWEITCKTARVGLPIWTLCRSLRTITSSCSKVECIPSAETHNLVFLSRMAQKLFMIGWELFLRKTAYILLTHLRDTLSMPITD
jgi:hypothetical protein